MDRYMQAPLDKEEVKALEAGDYVYITGTIYTARDAAHLRMSEALDRGEELPIDLNNNIIYYMGPTPAREGRVIGSAGPTTASRMDKYAPRLLDLGLTGMIGKGRRIYYMGPTPAREGRVIGSAGPTTASRMDKYAPRLLDLGLTGMIGKGRRKPEVTDAIVRNAAVFFAAVGGAGALLSKCIKKAEVIAYDDLGTEAIRKLEVENFPVIVVIDSKGRNLYDEVCK